MAKMVIDGGKGRRPDGPSEAEKAALAKELFQQQQAELKAQGKGAPEKKAKPAIDTEVPPEKQLGNHDYYKDNVLDREEKSHEDRGKEVVKDAVAGAQKRFGGFFSSVRSNLTRITSAVSRGFNMGIGAAASGMEGYRTVRDGVDKELKGMLWDGPKAFVTEGIPDLAKGGLDIGSQALDLVIGMPSRAAGRKTLELAMKATGTSTPEELYTRMKEAGKDVIMYEDLKELSEGLGETWKWAKSDESGEQITEAASHVLDATGTVIADATRATGRGLKKGAKGLAIAGAATAGVAATGVATAGAVTAGTVLGATVLGGAAAVGAGYVAGSAMEAAARATGRKLNQGIDALNTFAEDKVKDMEETKQALVMAGALTEMAGGIALADAKKFVSGVSKDLEAGLNDASKEAEKMVKEAGAVVDQAVEELDFFAQAEALNAKITLESAVTQGVAATETVLKAARDEIKDRVATAEKAIQNDLKRIETDLDTGAERMNKLYNEGVNEYDKFQGRVTEARSAWTTFLNAGRSALESFTSIFKGRGEKKREAEKIQAALEAKQRIDELTIKPTSSWEA